MLLFIGADDVYQRVSARLPSGAPPLVRCRDALELRGRLQEAALVIIDDGPEAGDALCRRLRDSPASSGLPLILCAPAGTQSVWADQVVDRVTMDTLEPALRELCPALPKAPSRSPGGYAFSAKAAAAAPPAKEPTLLETLETRRKAVDGLLSSGADAAAHADLITTTSKLLDESQRAINEALKTAALGRMRELTAARNVLFEKLQRFRSSRPAGAPTSAAGETTPGPEQGATGERRAASERGAASQRGTASERIALGPAATKSSLTLAAEAKEREARAKTRPAPPVRPRTKAPGSSSRMALWLGIAAIVLGAAAAVFVLYRPGPRTSALARNDNLRPKVTRVDIEKTPEGLRVRPMATDPERDPITFRIRWLVNGQPVRGVDGAELSKREYPRKATVQVEITASDGLGSGQPMISRPLRADGDRR